MDPLTLDRVCPDGDRILYPVDVLAGARTALVLFAAGFYGRQDACWIAEAGLEAVCVDVDARRLDTMRQLYPATWEFAVGDAYTFARTSRRRFDVVSCDPPTGQFARVAAELFLFCNLARRAVIVGSGRTPPDPPDGWQLERQQHRSDFAGGTYWSVLVPDEVAA